MKEISDIVKAYDTAQSEGKQTALATVVFIEGSSYRRPGARMLVTEDGKLTGAISGGCLEGDALRKALLVMIKQQPMVVTYDTTDEDDAKLGVGLGCNGVIQILIEPILPQNPDNAIALFKALLKQRQVGVIITIFSLVNKKAPAQGTSMLVTEEKIKISFLLNKPLNEALLTDAGEVLRSQISTIKTYGTNDEYTAFIEAVEPSIALVIVGAGNDAIPLAQFANILGWHITIADGRANYATAGRFPLANRVLVSKAENILSDIKVDKQTAVVLLTHNYNYDLSALEALLNSGIKYIGSLGPKNKLQRMLDELHEKGMEIDEAHIQNIYGPVGLDIGAETAEEIALSVIAEIKAAFSKRQGASLRCRETPIHLREPGKTLYN